MATDLEMKLLMDQINDLKRRLDEKDTARDAAMDAARAAADNGRLTRKPSRA